MQPDLALAQLILDTVAPGQHLLDVSPAAAAFTNSVQVLDTLSPAGNRLRLVVKRMTDDPDPARATADFRGLQIARRHGIPAPEPIYLDSTGELLGTPGIVTTFVEGTQIASPENPAAWAKDFADLLLRIHDVRLNPGEERYIYSGIDLGLFFLSGRWPKRKAGHALTDRIYETVRELRSSLGKTDPVFLHMDFWPGNVLWHAGEISAVLDWDAASYGDPALDVGYFRMNLYLRGIRQAADPFLEYYEASSGPVLNLGFWELAAAARPLPNPGGWIPASRQMGDLTATDDRADSDYYRFVADAIDRAHAGR